MEEQVIRRERVVRRDTRSYLAPALIVIVLLGGSIWLASTAEDSGHEHGALVADHAHTEGTPEQVCRHKTSYTGKFLKMHMARHGK